MSRELAGIAKYVQRIALQAPEIQSTLATLRARGAIPGLYTEAGGIEDDERQSCCDPENNGVIEEDVDTHNPWSSDDGNAPEQYTSTPEGVTDCETGDAVKVNFVGGFSQAETCKECAPDETWEAGTFWTMVKQGAVTDADAYATAVQSLQASADRQGYTLISVTKLNTNEYLGAYDTDGNGTANLWATTVRKNCSNWPVGSFSACDFTTDDVPVVCGDVWEADSATEYSVRNGCFVASKCDPDAPASALGCNEELTLCQDGVPWAFRPTDDGGWVQYDPAGIRTGGKYDKTGNRTAIIQPGQQTMY